MNCCILCPDPCSCIPYIQQIPGIIFELATIWNVWGRGTILLCESSMDEVFCAYFIEFVVTVAKGFFFAYWLAPVRQSLCVGRWWWPEYWKPPRVSNHFLNMFPIFIAFEFEFQLSIHSENIWNDNAELQFDSPQRVEISAFPRIYTVWHFVTKTKNVDRWHIH